MTARAALLSAALLLAAAPARAEDPPSQTLSLRAGAYLPLARALAGLEAGPEAELALGVRLLPHLFAELGAGLVRPGRSAAQVRDPLTGALRTLEPDLWDFPVGGGLRAVARAGPLVLSATAGLSVHFVRLQREVTQAGQLTRTTESDQASALGAQLGAEAALPLGRNVLAGLEGRWGSARPFLFGVRERLDGVRLGLRVQLGF